MERILGLDLGDKRVGVAISDELGIFATPLKVIENLSDEDVLNQLTDITEEWEIFQIVVGLPLNLDGSEGHRCVWTREMIAKMKDRYSDIEIVEWDERLSTIEAEKKRVESRGSKRGSKNKKDDIDSQAAQVILQRYLNYRYEKFSENDPDSPS